MKITLNELKQLVRQVIKEEEEKTGKKYSDDELREMIKEFKRLKEELEELEPKLDMMKSRHKELNEIIVDMMGPIKLAKGVVVELLDFSIKVERAGTENKINFSYKKGVDFVKDHGPKELVEQLNDLLDSTKTITKLSPSISVKSKLDESAIKDKLSNFIKKFKSWFSGMRSKFEKVGEMSADLKKRLAKVKKEM